MADSKSEMPSLAIDKWLHDATVQVVGARIGSARLDAEIILAHTLRKSRTFLHAHGDDNMSPRETEIADARLQLRLERTPIAYIIGHKEFYGRQFQVTPATLVPRPESETIITILKELNTRSKSLFNETTRLVDVGTGTGCLGITAKLEIPTLDVTLLDISKHALNVAHANAKRLNADCTIKQSDLLSAYPFAADFIIANLPYVDPQWERSPETNYEPEIALFAQDGGLGLIKTLINQVPSRLTKTGALIIEADPRQHEAIIAYAKKQHLIKTRLDGFIIVLQKA